MCPNESHMFLIVVSLSKSVSEKSLLLTKAELQSVTLKFGTLISKYYFVYNCATFK